MPTYTSKFSVRNRKESWASQQSNISTSFIFPGRKISESSSEATSLPTHFHLPPIQSDKNFDPLVRQQVEWNVRQVRHTKYNMALL